MPRPSPISDPRHGAPIPTAELLSTCGAPIHVAELRSQRPRPFTPRPSPISDPCHRVLQDQSPSLKFSRYRNRETRHVVRRRVRKTTQSVCRYSFLSSSCNDSTTTTSKRGKEKEWVKEREIWTCFWRERERENAWESYCVLCVCDLFLCWCLNLWLCFCVFLFKMN